MTPPVMTPRAMTALLIGGMLVLTGSGCAKDTPASTTSPVQSSTSTDAPSPTDAPSSTDAATPTDATSPALPAGSASASGAATGGASSSSGDGLGSVVGSRSATSQGNAYTVRVYPLTRAGGVVTLNAVLSIDKVTQKSPVNLGILADPHDLISKAKGLVNGFGLVDAASSQLFMPATTTDAADTAVCSPTFPSLLEAGDQVTISCTYAQVPPTISTVSVTIPTFGTVPNVPIR